MIKRSFLLLAAFIFISQNAIAQSFEIKHTEFIWSETYVSNEVLFEFVDLNEDETIRLLREKYKIKVFILSSNIEPNPHLTVSNLSSDLRALNYYENAVDGQSTVTTQGHIRQARGQYLPAYFHKHDEASPIFRPLYEYPTILINASAPKNTLIHEFLHHHQHDLQIKEPVLINNMLHHPLCKKTIDIMENNKKVNVQTEALNELGLFTRRATRNKAAYELALSNIRLFNETFEILSQYGGIEIDVYRMMFENRELLELSNSEALDQLSSVELYYKLMLQKNYPRIEGIMTYAKQMFERWPQDRAIKNEYTRLVRMESDIFNKMEKTRQWYNDQNFSDKQL